MDLKIENLLGFYRPITTPQFQAYMYSLLEMREKATPVDFKPKNEPGVPYNHQELFTRYLREFPELAYFAEAGTGKTCSLGALSTYYMEHSNEIDHVYIFTGRTQVDDVMRQLVYTCHKPEVYRDKVEAMATEKAKKGKMKRITAHWYTVTTYSVFISDHVPLRARRKGYNPNFMTDDDIRNLFRRCIFFLDEVQKLKIIPGVYAGQKISRILKPEQQSSSSSNPRRSNINKAKSLSLRLHSYMQFWRILHLAEGCKKIIASARPISNILEEFVFHMNLILPLHLQLRETPDRKDSLVERMAKHLGFAIKSTYVNLENPDTDQLLEDLRPFLQGRIMYFRGFKIGAIPKYIGKSVPFEFEINGQTIETKLTLNYVTMHSHQRKYYNEAAGNTEIKISELIDDENRQGKVKNSFHLQARQAAGFVFPDGRYDVEAYHDYVSNDEDGTNIRTRNNDKGKVLKKWLTQDVSYKGQKVNGLRMMSAKMYHIVKSAYEQPGKRYVYSWLVKAGGAFLIALALQAGFDGKKGFQQYTGKEDHFQADDDTFELDGCCETSANPQGRIVNLKPRLRYAILFSKNKAQHSNIFKIFNSPENVNGDYIKVIIVSRVGQIGINLSDCLHEDIMEPDFSPSSQYQGDMRIFRATAYVNTIKQRKSQGILTSRNQANDAIEVNINYLAVQGREGDPTSIDTQIYHYARFKDIMISRLARVYKRLTFDCHINFHHNVRATDIDYSVECDYQECPDPQDSNAFCADPKYDPDVIDTSTYDVYYIDELIQRVITHILIPYFRSTSSATIGNLLDFQASLKLDFEPANMKQMYFALEWVITNRMPFYNAFGYKSYLAVEGDTFFLVQTAGTFSDSYYTRNLIGLTTHSLADVNLTRNIDRSKAIWDDVLATYGQEESESDSEDETERISPVIRKIVSLPNGAQTAYFEFIISSYHYILVKGHRLDAASQAVIDLTLQHFGNKLIPENAAYSSDYDSGKPSIYVHKIYNPYAQKTYHGAASQEEKAIGILRILEVGSVIADDMPSWRDCALHEQRKYQAQFSEFIATVRGELARKHPIYIWKMGDKYLLNDRRKITQSDRRSHGTNIMTMNVLDLIGIAYDLGAKRKERIELGESANRQFSDDEIRENFYQRLEGKNNPKNMITRKDLAKFDRDKLNYYWNAFTSEYVSKRGGRSARGTGRINIKGADPEEKGTLVGSIVAKLREMGAFYDGGAGPDGELPNLEEYAASNPKKASTPKVSTRGRGRGRGRGSRAASSVRD